MTYETQSILSIMESITMYSVFGVLSSATLLFSLFPQPWNSLTIFLNGKSILSRYKIL